jgi:hypothetical protein
VSFAQPVRATEPRITHSTTATSKALHRAPKKNKKKITFFGYFDFRSFIRGRQEPTQQKKSQKKEIFGFPLFRFWVLQLSNGKYQKRKS